MDNLPRQMLTRILAKHGKEICSDARRCENLLKDLCGSNRREINVLVNAIEERVPLDLLAANRSMPLELLVARLEKRLEEQTALTADAARWAVESWAIALNLTTESEIQTKRKQAEPVAPPIRKTETAKPVDSTASETPNVSRSNAVQLPKRPTIVPPRTVPPVNKQPQQTPRTTSPPVIAPANNQPPPLPPVQAPANNQPTTVRKGFGVFRGCLVVLFLLAIATAVLFLGVPYAIEVMRETQRERNSEPPRFPVR